MRYSEKGCLPLYCLSGEERQGGRRISLVQALVPHQICRVQGLAGCTSIELVVLKSWSFCVLWHLCVFGAEVSKVMAKLATPPSVNKSS